MITLWLQTAVATNDLITPPTPSEGPFPCQKEYYFEAFCLFSLVVFNSSPDSGNIPVTRQICSHGDNGHGMTESIKSAKVNFSS